MHPIRTQLRQQGEVGFHLSERVVSQELAAFSLLSPRRECACEREDALSVVRGYRVVQHRTEANSQQFRFRSALAPHQRDEEHAGTGRFSEFRCMRGRDIRIEKHHTDTRYTNTLSRRNPLLSLLDTPHTQFPGDPRDRSSPNWILIDDEEVEIVPCHHRSSPTKPFPPKTYRDRIRPCVEPL